MLGSCLGNQGGLRCGNTLSLVGAATSNIFVATNVLLRQTRVCYNKHVCYDKTCLLSRQKYGCQDKTFVQTNIFLLRQKHNFVATKLLPRQAYFCRDKHVFVATTKQKTEQNKKRLFWHACGNETFVMTNTCLSWQKYFVATNIILSLQKFCHGKHTFVTTKDVFCRDKHVFVAKTANSSVFQCTVVFLYHSRLIKNSNFIQTRMDNQFDN